MNIEYIRFLNLEYVFCVIYSLFGGKCATDLDSQGIGTIDGIAGVGSTTTPSTLPGVLPVDIGLASGTQGFFQTLIDTITFAGTVIGGAFVLLWAMYSALAYTVSGLLLMLILSSLAGLMVIRYREMALYGTLPRSPSSKHPLKKRWQELLDHAMSTDPKLWKEGIIAADEMLGELLEKLGYQGSTTTDKMRIVAEGAFVTLPAAWEAHRVRNFVAGRTSDYILTQREAFRVLKLYEQVFEEFKFI